MIYCSASSCQYSPSPQSHFLIKEELEEYFYILASLAVENVAPFRKNVLERERCRTAMTHLYVNELLQDLTWSVCVETTSIKSHSKLHTTACFCLVKIYFSLQGSERNMIVSSQSVDFSPFSHKYLLLCLYWNDKQSHTVFIIMNYKDNSVV